MHPRFYALIASALLAFPLSSQASLTTDLQSLNTNLASLNTQMSATQLNGTTSPCLQIGTLNTSIENYIQSAETIKSQLTSTLSVTADDLTALNNMSNTLLSISQEAIRLSVQLKSGQLVNGTLTLGSQSFSMVEYEASMAAMLRLSSDIGKMSDRILEMADRILAMSNNIGTMADRILATQTLQSSNLALIEQAMLTTQSNMVAFNASVSTIAYNVSLANLKLNSQALQNSLSTPSSLTQYNMSTQLLAIQAQSAALVTQMNTLTDWAIANSGVMSSYIDGDTLTSLGDLSGIYQALSVSLQAYANTVNQLAPLTTTPVLKDATAAMLQLTSDIGTMAGRIMTMSDKIIVEADNVGTMAGRIVTTENIQKSNLALTIANLNSAQNTTISVIKNAGL